MRRTSWKVQYVFLNHMINILITVIFNFIRKLKQVSLFLSYQACPFIIDIYADKCKPRIKAVHMEACSGQLEKAICKSVLNKGDARVMDGYENIIVHTYKRDTWITSVIENKVLFMRCSPHNCIVY